VESWPELLGRWRQHVESGPELLGRWQEHERRAKAVQSEDIQTAVLAWDSCGDQVCENQGAQAADPELFVMTGNEMGSKETNANASFK